MFNFFKGDDENSAAVIKNLRDELRSAKKQIDDLTIKASDAREERRSYYEDMLLDARMRASNAARTLKERIATLEDDMTKVERNTRKPLEEEILKLKSEIRELKLEAEEEKEDFDLVVARGINEFKEEHAEDVHAEQIKNAKLAGELAAAKAENASKDAIILSLEVRLADANILVGKVIDTLALVAPSVDLDKFNVSIEVPVQKNNDKKS